MCYDLVQMIRRIGYRTAATAFVFAGLWFLIGLVALVSPIPGALGIGGEMLLAWGLLFLVILGAAGVTLVLAAINGLFPPDAPSPGAGAIRQSAPPAASRITATTAGPPTHDADGRPLPWSTSPLPDRVPRRTTTATRPRPSRPADGNSSSR